MSSLAFQIRDLEVQYADFDSFLSQRKWSDAQAIIDNLWDSNPQSAEFMRRKFLTAQFEATKEEPDTHPEPKEEYEKDSSYDDTQSYEGAYKETW